MSGPGPWVKGSTDVAAFLVFGTLACRDPRRPGVDPRRLQRPRLLGPDRPPDPALRRPRPGLDRCGGPGRDPRGPLRSAAAVRRADGRPRPPRRARHERGRDGRVPRPLLFRKTGTLTPNVQPLFTRFP